MIRPVVGRGENNPIAVYYALRGVFGFLLALAASVNLVFQTQEASLNPLQLVLVGALFEATIFVLEIPTGVVADVYSRRLSVVLGLGLVGSGLIVSASWPIFETILLGQVIWGCGHAFLSGSNQAWIADEIGVESVGPVYLRSAQFEQVGRLVATPMAIGIAAYDLNLPILIAGAAMIVMAPVMLGLMSERGFQGQTSGLSTREILGRASDIFVEGGRLVRGSPLLMTIFAIAAFYGMAGEGFDRLWVAHFYRDLGFPGLFDLKPVIWIGVVRMGWIILSFLALAVAIKRVETTSDTGISRALMLVNLLQALSLFVLAAASGFTMGMVAVWLAIALAATYPPLFLTWMNQHVDSRVRATVISMRSQTDALGQIAGGPMLGLVGQFGSLRLAMFGAGLTLVPALALYLRANRLGRNQAEPESAET